jgi:hypothetical protein
MSMPANARTSTDAHGTRTATAATAAVSASISTAANRSGRRSSPRTSVVSAQGPEGSDDEAGRRLALPDRDLALRRGSSSLRARADDAVWVHENAYKIGDAVGRMRDPEKLRRVAEIVGYEPRVGT